MEHLIELRDVYKIYQMGEETVHALDDQPDKRAQQTTLYHKIVPPFI